jgi:hypothetical protein
MGAFRRFCHIKMRRTDRERTSGANSYRQLCPVPDRRTRVAGSRRSRRFSLLLVAVTILGRAPRLGAVASENVFYG